MVQEYDQLEQRIKTIENIKFTHIGIPQGVQLFTLPHPNMHVAVTYTITNGTTDRTYNANATSVDELADILYTLIQDLKLLGLVS